MTVTTRLCWTAILWFAASAFFATAAVLTYIQEEQVNWLLFTGSLLMVILGINSLRRMKS
ncbi:MAG: hypothetical protein JST85_04850 [Acidobacteria bacterium]|nr:hypothetical protein [Acidobacteriota bacterium]